MSEEPSTTNQSARKSEQELRDALADVQHVLADFDRQEQQLNTKQAKLKEQRVEFEKSEKRLTGQLKQIVAAQHGQTTKQTEDGKTPVNSNRAQNFQQADTAPKNKMVTKAQYDNLIDQVTRPKVTAAPKPPFGIRPSVAETVDRDMKILAKARQIRAKLDGAGQQVQKEFKRAKKQGRK